MIPLITVFPDRFVRSWPNADDARAIVCLASDSLSQAVSSDAHFAAYASDLPRRHSVDLLRGAEHRDKIGPANVRMTLAVFDVDAPGHAWSEAWWRTEERKIARLSDEHPGTFAYTTRGGYRLAYALPKPFSLRLQSDAETWTSLYRGWCRYLARRFEIEADTACADWTRLYRAPFAARDGVPQSTPCVKRVLSQMVATRHGAADADEKERRAMGRAGFGVGGERTHGGVVRERARRRRIVVAVVEDGAREAST